MDVLAADIRFAGHCETAAWGDEEVQDCGLDLADYDNLGEGEGEGATGVQ